MAQTNDLLQITLPYACYGIALKDGWCIDAPPIAKWMIGKSILYIADWVKGKKGKSNYIYED